MSSVASMRRATVILALIAAMLAVAPPSAAAHACATPVTAPIGKPASITVGVGAEKEAVVHVVVDVPAGFRLTGERAAQGWTGSHRGSHVTFSGGQVTPFDCSYFTIVGVATRKGILAFPITVRTSSGASDRYAKPQYGYPNSAQLVYAGVQLDVASTGQRSRAAQTAVVIAIAIAVVAAVGTALWLAKRPKRNP